MLSFETNVNGKLGNRNGENITISNRANKAENKKAHKITNVTPYFIVEFTS